jgi:hypothetical protein
MFSLGALAAIAALAGFAGYQYSKAKNNNTTTVTTPSAQADTNKDSTAKSVNTYNYYTNDSENGTTLFGQQKKTKRTLFGTEA